MIALYVKDRSQINWLSIEMDKADIPYYVVETDNDCGMGFPFLIVDGVPLDVTAAMTWIESRDCN